MDAVEKAIADKERLFILRLGGIRAGKSKGAVQCLIRHSLEYENQNYLVCHYTARLVLANLVPIFQSVCNQMELPLKVVRGTSPRMEIGSNTFHIFGGADMGREKSIQGITAAGIIADEYPLLHRDFLAQAEARISVKGAIRIYTGNKGSPYHWATKHYYDRIKNGEINGVLIDSDVKDNQHLDETFIEERYSEYDDIHKTRFMDNEFALVLPPIYNVQLNTNDEIGYVVACILWQRNTQMLELAIFYDEDNDYYTIKSFGYSDIPITDTQSQANEVLISPNNPILRKAIRETKKRVRGYSDIPNTRIPEICQHLFAAGKIKVANNDNMMLQQIDEYNCIGLYNGIYIQAIETLCQYLYTFKGLR